MKFNNRGDYAAGVKGDGGVVSVNDVPVFGPSAQFGGWLDDDRCVLQFYAPGRSPIIATSRGEVLAERGANMLSAGGGVWAARLDGFGLFSSTGFGGPDLYLSAMGPDGAIAYTPHAGFPIKVKESDGSVWLLSETPAKVTLLGNRRALLYTNDARGSDLVTIRVTHPRDLPQRFYSYVQRGDWCAYQDEANGGRVVVRRVLDGSQGWTILAPLAYGIDLCELPGKIRVGFSRGEGEQPGDFVIQDFALDEPMQSLAVASPPVVSVPPVIVPPSEPEPVPVPITSHLSTVQAVRAKYGDRPTDEELGTMLNEIAWIHRAEGYGLSEKPNGTNAPSPQGKRIAHDVLHKMPEDVIIDVFVAAGAEAAPTWNQVAHHNNPDRPWLAPIMPAGHTEPPAEDPDPGDVNVPPSVPPSSDDVRAAIAALDAKVTRLLSVFRV